MDPLTPLNASEASGEHPKDVLAQDKKIETPQKPSASAHVDLGKILLPKKEEPGHTVDSAQRINAGALLEQEVKASKEGTDAQQVHTEEKAAEVKPTPAPAPESEVKQLETYQRDIESVVQNGNLSVLSIATAEANRRSGTSLPDANADPKQATLKLWQNIAMIAGGVIFLIGASGLVAYLVTRPTSVPLTATATPSTPYINVDAVKDITITAGVSRDQIMASLNAARQATSLSLGLMSQLLVTVSSSTSNGDVLSAIPAQNFFALVTPNMPPVLSRSFVPAYLLGVHEYNGEQAFIIAKVYSYEEAYSGMLSWEPYLQQDLSPLFNYTPTQHIQGQGVVATTTDTSNQFIKTGFVDRIVENHDARVLQNSFGDIYLLWTFLDRNTLVITTNEATLREIISRLKSAPITPIPGTQ